MFDNFGLGEFFFLALLALLFFGPERLPQIGAQLGKWIARLTQYSKTFMNEWRDEALAIHEAVEEVRGIRDELVAARAEISSTLDTARGDLTEGIDIAREAVTGARMDVTNRLALQQQEAAADLERIAREERGEASPDEDGEDAALARTQQILDDLRKSREEALLARAEAMAAEKAGEEDVSPERPSDTEPSVSEAEVMVSEEGASEEAEWEHIRGLIEAGLSPSPRRPDVETSGEEGAEPAPAEVTEPETAEVEAAKGEDGASVLAQVIENAPEPPRETAFDRSQKILEEPTDGKAEPEVVKVEDGASVLAQVAEQPPAPPKETAFDRSQKILEDLKKRRAKSEETPAVEETTADSGAAAEVEIRSPEFQELAAQVVHLQDEIGLLRQELEALRDLSTRSVAEQNVPPTSDEVSVEEAA
jgi:Sec-independent protein translocase protein TatA